jgi:antirestriction factor ArdC-like protein
MSFPNAATPAANAASNGATRSSNPAPHSKNAALRTRSDSPYQQRTTQKENPAQLVIKQAVDFLIQQLEAGKSETLTAYLGAMARFHEYSFGNIMAIARQRPTATRVAGLRAWNELGRFVRKGEKGIQILAPMIGQRRRRDTEEQEQSTNTDGKPAPMLIGFRAVYVFDRLSRDLRPAWPATVRRRRARGLHACASMAAATSSLNSLARCKAVWMRTSSSSRAAICPAGSLCPLAAFRLR